MTLINTFNGILRFCIAKKNLNVWIKKLTCHLLRCLLKDPLPASKLLWDLIRLNTIFRIINNNSIIIYIKSALKENDHNRHVCDGPVVNTRFDMWRNSLRCYAIDRQSKPLQTVWYLENYTRDPRNFYTNLSGF